MSKKSLVAFFSPTGTTKQVALALAKTAGADLYEIRPAVPYTAADLDWTDKKSRSTVEMNDAAFRPALAEPAAAARIGDYEVIYLGFPIWWYVAPTLINSFLESGDFAGKTIVLFATSGGSGFGKTVEALRASCAGARLVTGKLLNRGSDAELRALIKLAE